MNKDEIRNNIKSLIDEYNNVRATHLIERVKDPISMITDFCFELIQKEISNLKNRKYLIVEDGSVDVDKLEEELLLDNIKLIVYRQGTNKPQFLE